MFFFFLKMLTFCLPQVELGEKLCGIKEDDSFILDRFGLIKTVFCLQKMEHIALLLYKTVTETRHINVWITSTSLMQFTFCSFANFHFVLIFHVTEAGRNCRETTTTDLVGKILLLGTFSGSNISCNY